VTDTERAKPLRVQMIKEIVIAINLLITLEFINAWSNNNCYEKVNVVYPSTTNGAFVLYGDKKMSMK
jgi:hypothetical protein